MAGASLRGGGRKSGGKRNNGSCHSHFIVQPLFMNTLSGWKESQAAPQVSDCGSCAITTGSSGYFTADMDFICRKTLFIYFQWEAYFCLTHLIYL